MSFMLDPSWMLVLYCNLVAFPVKIVLTLAYTRGHAHNMPFESSALIGEFLARDFLKTSYTEYIPHSILSYLSLLFTLLKSIAWLTGFSVNGHLDRLIVANFTAWPLDLILIPVTVVSTADTCIIHVCDHPLETACGRRMGNNFIISDGLKLVLWRMVSQIPLAFKFWRPPLAYY